MDAAILCGYKPHQGKLPCFNHPDKTPSMHLFPDHYYSFCCGANGDVIDLVSKLKGCSLRDAFDFLDAGQPDPEMAPRSRNRNEWFDFSDRLSAVQIGPSRALDGIIGDRWGGTLYPLTLLSWGCRWDSDTLYIPHYGRVGVTGVKTRSLHPPYGKRSLVGSRFTQGLYRREHDQVLAGSPVWVVEGESDAWAMSQDTDARVLALPSGAGVWYDEWASAARLHKHSVVLVATDMDEAGHRAAARILDAVPNGVRVNLPGNDVVESIVGGWVPFA